MAVRIQVVETRAKLKPRAEPYWHRVAGGCQLGFRRMTAEGPGTWIAKYRDPSTGERSKRSLGSFEGVPASQQFDAAKREAEKWFSHLGKGGRRETCTVRDVCDRYVQHLGETKGEKAAADARKRFSAYVLDDAKFAAMDVTKLTPAAIEQWRRRLRDRPTTGGGSRGGTRTPSTLNRDMTCFRAALNRAHDDGLVTTDFAWRVKLRPIKDADERRTLYLDRDERRRLIEVAQPDVAVFLRAMCQLPLRPGALSALTVAQFNARLATITVRDDKAGRGRAIALPPPIADLFRAAAKDKLPGAPLFTRSDGKPWNKDAWKGPVKDAVRAAGLDASASIYTLRHSVITDLVHGGLDLLTVAQVAGTSVRMIERHYGHLSAEHSAAALAKLAL